MPSIGVFMASLLFIKHTYGYHAQRILFFKKDDSSIVKSYNPLYLASPQNRKTVWIDNFIIRPDWLFCFRVDCKKSYYDFTFSSLHWLHSRIRLRKSLSLHQLDMQQEPFWTLCTRSEHATCLLLRGMASGKSERRQCQG